MAQSPALHKDEPLGDSIMYWWAGFLSSIPVNTNLGRKSNLWRLFAPKFFISSGDDIINTSLGILSTGAFIFYKGFGPPSLYSIIA